MMPSFTAQAIAFFAVALQLCVSGNLTADNIAFVTVGAPAARYMNIVKSRRVQFFLGP